MVVFVVSEGYASTVAQVKAAASGFRVEIALYPAIFGAPSLPRATYVFCDLDRLSLPALRYAADIYKRLKAAGVRVLNDPAQVPSRYGLLRRLYLAGFNRFNAYRVEEQVRPERWPVFLRYEGFHEVPVTGLLDDYDQLQREIEQALASGAPLASLLVVEYAAEPIRPGLFRKLSTFQVGGASFAHNCVHDDNWVAKRGKKGIAGEDLYQDELRIARDNPYEREVREAFRIACMDYGRADFGIVGGKVQVYEINSNPDMKFATEHPSPLRLETWRIFKAHYMEAIRAIDTPDGGTVSNESKLLEPIQRHAAALRQAQARKRG
jgi:hypothetical protein